MEKKGFGFCFIFMLLFIFFASQEMVAEAKPRVCESQSRGFRGACLISHNCALVCRNEGFTGGICRGFRRRCFCTKRC